MSQFGMQMPGGRKAQGAGPDVYTGLMFFAVLALLAGCAVLYFAAAKVAPEGQPWKVHEATQNGRVEIRLADS